MKLEYAKDWYENRIAIEGDEEVGAGIPPGLRTTSLANSSVMPVDTRIIFGTFVTLWRRNRGWNTEKLAETAGLDLEEIREIEQNPRYEPEPEVVYKLAGLFGVSPDPLLELTGAIEPGIPSLQEEVVRYYAGSESVAALNERERYVFEAFLSSLSESAHEYR